MLARSLTRDAHHDDDDDGGGDYDYDEEDSDNGDVLSRLFRGEYSSRAPRRPLKADKRTRLNPPQACFPYNVSEGSEIREVGIYGEFRKRGREREKKRRKKLQSARRKEKRRERRGKRGGYSRV